jgi:hypothetical protein
VAGLTLLSGGVALDLNVKHALEELIERTTEEEDADGDERRDASRDEREDEETERARTSRGNGGETS